MRYLSVCSGIEAATQAWHPLGWTCAGVSEIEPFPRAVLEYRLGAVPVEFDEHQWREGSNTIPLFGDFTKIEEHHVGPIDLLVGGTPCQSFSVAGKRAGLDDPRGNLTLEFLALAKRLRPRWIVWENVPGVLSHDEGRTMGTFLRLVGECGFRWAYRVLDAQYVRVGRFGRAVPQRRRRVFLVGYSGAGGVDPRAVLFDRESLRGNPAPRREAGEGTSADVARSLRGGGPGCARTGDSRGQDPVIAQAFGGGNTSGPVPVAAALAAHGRRQDFEVETFVAHALRGEGFDASEDGTGRGTPIVPVAYRTTGNDGCYETGDVVGALDATTDKNARILAYGIATQQEPKWAEDLCPTLQVPSKSGGGQPHAVAFDMRGREGGAMPEGPHDTANIRAASGGSSRSYVAANWRVRRLTPTECARLQGFPDDWCRIPWRGKPAEQCPDGPQYKAYGNSKAINVVTWIGERIAAVDALSGQSDAKA